MAFAADAPINTDDNMRIELEAPRTLYVDRVAAIDAALAEHPPDPSQIARGYDSEAALHLDLANSYFTAGADEMAMEFCQRAIDLAPSFDGMKLLGQIAQRQGDTLLARNAYSLALTMGGDTGSRAFVQGLLQSLDSVFVSND